MPVWIVCGHLGGFGIGECLVALVGLAMYLYIIEASIGFRELVRVT